MATTRSTTPAKKAAAKKAAPAKRATSATKKATTSRRPAKKATPPPADEPERGPVEASTLADLTAGGAAGSGLAMSALKLARLLDATTSGAEAQALARELRMTTATALAVGKPISPTSGSDDGSEVVVGADRLEQARKRSASGAAKRAGR